MSSISPTPMYDVFHRAIYEELSICYEIGVTTFCSLKFLTFSVMVANPKKLLFYLYKFANPARGLLIRGGKKVWHKQEESSESEHTRTTVHRRPGRFYRQQDANTCTVVVTSSVIRVV